MTHLLVLLCLVTGETKWVEDSSCRKSYSEEQLNRYVPEIAVRNVVHSCVGETIQNKSLSPPLSLKWSQMKPYKSRKAWHSIYEKMANKKLFLVGDSVMFQVLIGMMLYLESIGIICQHLSEGTFLCPNGLEISRPSFTAKLSDEFLPSVYQSIANSDIAIINTGLHYGIVTCVNLTSLVCSDIRHVFDTLSLNYTNATVAKKVAWLDTLIPHFPASQGSYQEWKAFASHQIECGPIQEPLSYTSLVAYESSQMIKHKYPYVPVIELYDIVYDRYDMHQGLLTHNGDVNRLDCVHFCMQPCFWAAISMRVGKTLLMMVGHVKE
jgi:hypothetical protein